MKHTTPNTSRRLLLLASLLVPVLAQSQVITLTNSDALGNSSFNTIGNWDSGAAPAAGNNYVTSTNVLRTPADSANYFFAGSSLTLQAPVVASSSSLLLKGLTNNLYSFNNLTGSNGIVYAAGASTQTYGIFGSTVLTTNTTLTVNSANGPINLNGPISGPGGLTVSGYTTTLNGSNSLSGATTVSSGTLKAGAGPVVMPFS